MGSLGTASPSGKENRFQEKKKQSSSSIPLFSFELIYCQGASFKHSKRSTIGPWKKKPLFFRLDAVTGQGRLSTRPRLLAAPGA